MEIQWKSLDWIDSRYSISNTGLVKSEITGKTLAFETSYKGYRRVSIKGKHYTIHRLMALAFIPNPDNLPQVNHIDGNKLNNDISNLEWCTNQYNQKHAWKNKLRIGRKGLQPWHKLPNGILLTKEDIEDIWLLKQYLPVKEIAKLHKVSIYTIYDIFLGRTWKL